MFNFLLNKFKTLCIIKVKAPLAFITLALFIALFTLCCGKRTPPVPPTERVSQIATISGFQLGNQVVLSWKMSARNSSENDTNYINRIDVYRLAEPNAAPQQITEEEFSSRSTLIDSITVGSDDFSLKTFTYSDNLEFSDQAARLRYAVRFVNKTGQKASFSNFLTIEPSAKIAQRPANLSSDITQEAIILKWEKPETNVDGSTPANILGYNIYRRLDKETQAKKLNTSPISDTEYSDIFFDFKSKYIYFVRAVSVGSGGAPVESSSSEETELTPQDTFAPSPPASVTIAASPDSISLFFAANPEKDISGYKVYRSTDKNLSLENWELLTPEPIKTNTFSDQNIKSGIRYFYYLTAIDAFGNVSQPSQIIDETAP
ncbi:hypothetical protein BH20ACI4_BH20ACI4_00630 [soil metagenome]